MHKQAYHKIFVYYIINTLNILLALQVWVFFAPAFNILVSISYFIDYYFKAILVVYIISTFGSIYFLIQNASFVYVIGTDYLLFETEEIDKLNSEFERLDKSKNKNNKDFRKLKEKWKYLYKNEDEKNGNLNLKQLKEDIEILKRVQ